jgi:hypothetical protein
MLGKIGSEVPKQAAPDSEAIKAQLAAAENRIRQLETALADETRKHQETRSALKKLLTRAGGDDATFRPLFASPEDASTGVPTKSVLSPPVDADSPASGGRQPLVDDWHLQQLLGAVEMRLFQQSPIRTHQQRQQQRAAGLLSPPALTPSGRTAGSKGGVKSPTARSATPSRGYAGCPPQHVGFGNGTPRFREFVQAGDQTVFASSSSCSKRHHHDQLQFSPAVSGAPLTRTDGGVSAKAAQLRQFLRAASPARHGSAHLSPIASNQSDAAGLTSPWLA